MRSVSGRARRAAGLAGLGCAAGIGLGGCATTQQEAARLQLNAARVRASQVPSRVSPRATSATVHAIRLQTLGNTFVVTVRNASAADSDDLPIDVGYITGSGRRVVLNASSDLYSGNHLPLVRGDQTVTWLDPLTRRLPHGARPFALIGRSPSPPAAIGTALPRIAVEHVQDGKDGSSVSLSLVNETSVPQYQLPIYAIGRTGGRVTAAGTAFVTHLGSHATADLRVRLAGRLGGATLSVEALPTIFH